jgi:DNA-binding TFAR19-related protein (PDSD5 family)
MEPQKTVGDVVGERLLVALEAAEEKLDADIERLERLDEDDLERIRRQRLDQLKRQHNKKQEWIAKGHGEYREIHDQKQFFEELKKEERAVVHFFRPSTRRCEIVDKHLLALSQKHIETRFVKVDAEKCPFIAEKLRIM